MNAIPQKAHNYERIRIPRDNTANISAQQRMGRITDMQAYNMRKIAMQRKKAYEERMEYERARQQEQRQKAARSAQQQQQQRRDAYDAREVVRQRGVKNVVGGRKLTPAYEVSTPAGGYGYSRSPYEQAARRRSGQMQQRAAAPAYERDYERAYERPVKRPAQPRRKPIHGFDMVETTDATAYHGVKPIAVEYEAPKRKGVVSTIILIAVVFAVLAGILIRYSQISNLNYQNAQIESRIGSLSQDLDKAKMEVSLREDLSSIRQQAAAMGMSEPKDSQIVFVEPEAAVQDVPETSTVQDALTAEGSTDISQGAQANGDAAASGFSGFINTILDTIKGWFQN
ncbi:MAG: hypothetical protein VB081_14225 [Christensenella sp.]|uniref:hypothetical protein n=1 Tax=Christensenella sp. TaxID=1935934 RepID=UPI002B204312|nr:hypothetical protein [Christensenella sp.]MEA5004640.1 hypothetical protein [Christensenella sp.]